MRAAELISARPRAGSTARRLDREAPQLFPVQEEVDGLVRDLGDLEANGGRPGRKVEVKGRVTCPPKIDPGIMRENT